MEEGFWHNQGDVIDASANANHANAFGAIPSDSQPAVSGNPGTCRYGQFDGNDYIDSAVNISETDFTLSLWFRTTSANGGLFVAKAGSVSHGAHDRNVYLVNGNIRARLWRSQTITSSGKNYADGAWHHLVYTYGTAVNGQQLYVDGVLVASGNKPSSNFTTQRNVMIGYSQNRFGGYFTGDIDEIALYNTAFTASQVSSQMQASHTCVEPPARPNPEPLAEYRMEETSWNNAINAVIDNTANGNHATAIGAQPENITPALMGNPGSCAYGSFDGDDYINSNLNISENTFALSLWFRTSRTNGGLFVVKAGGLSSGAQDRNVSLANGNIRAFLWSNQTITSRGKNYADGEWHHLIYTYGFAAQGQKLYVDGTLVAFANKNFSNFYWQTNVMIGYAQNRGGYFYGDIDEVKLYNTTLVDSDIIDIMQARHPCNEISPLPEPVSAYHLDSNNWSGSAGEVLDGGVNNLHGITANGVVFANSIPAISGDEGTCGYAEFNGVNQYIQIEDNPLFDMQDELTITAWVRPNVLGFGGWKTLVSKNENFEFHLIGDGTVLWWWRSVAGVRSFRTREKLTVGQWHHVAITYSRSRASQRIYINGVPSSQKKSFSEQLLTTNNPLQFAQDQFYGRRYFEGALDEIRVYNAALSTTQINQVMQLKRPCSALNHYRIKHAGTYATCEAAAIKIIGHDAAHTKIAPGTQTITVSTSTAKGDWALARGVGIFDNGAPDDGIARYTFAPTERSVKLYLTHLQTASAVNINVSDGSRSDIDGDANEDPPLTYAQAALRFYADGMADAIGTKISAKPSNLPPENQALTLRAVQSNTDTGLCEAALQGSQTVSLAYSCEDPVTCASNQTLTLAGSAIAANPLVNVNDFTDVTLNFDATGEAELSTLTYSDAGLIRLHAKGNVPPNAPNPAFNIEGSSIQFVVKPDGLCVETTDNNSSCPTQNSNCSPFIAAGDAFNLTVSGRGWESNTDTDLCATNPLTPNYRASGITLEPELLSPSGTNAVNGRLTIATANIVDNGETNIDNQSYSEVGVIRINARPPLYHSESIPSTNSAAIGRFTPAYFEAFALNLKNRSDLSACAPNPTFTYLGEPLTVNLSISAFNRNGGLTQNYHNGSQANENFAMLADFDQLNIAPLNGTNNLATRTNNENTQPFNWNLTPGEALITANFSVSREPTGIIDGSFTDTRIGIAPIDDDRVALEPGILNMDTENPAGFDRFDIGGTDLYYGRLHIQNAFGPQQQTLAMPVTAEYFNGQRFVKNTQDNCTPIEIPTLENYEGNLQSGETGVINLFSPLIGGSGEIELAATPSIDDYGSVDVTIDTEPWLKFNWNEALTGDETPTGKATFGIYRGHDRIIYRHEVLQ